MKQVMEVPSPKSQLYEPGEMVYPVEAETTAASWGWLPALSLNGAVALFLLAITYTLARRGDGLAESLFWVGLIMLFAPIAARLAASQVSRRETIGLLVFLGFGLYLVKLLHSPAAFTLHDEFLHLRTVGDIASSGRLFELNPLLPVSALYPGMETVAVALSSLSGLPMFVTGVLLIGVARLVFVLALYLFFEEVSRSQRVAGLATLIYMTNPNFLFFLAMFKYESLALPIAILVLFLLARRRAQPNSLSVGLTLAALLSVSLVVITHHLTAYALMALLFLWTAAGYLSRGKAANPGPGRVASLLLIENLTWLTFAANITFVYLLPHFQSATAELMRVIAQDANAGRVLFENTGNPRIGTIPEWETWFGYASAGLILLGIPFGLMTIRQKFRHIPLALALGAGSLLYPASLVFRFTRRGWEIANRSSEFVYLFVGFVIAVGLVKFLQSAKPRPYWQAATGLGVTILLLGGIIAGWPRVWRLPGSYQDSFQTHHLDTQNKAAADWARTMLGPGNRMGADASNTLVLGSYGEQDMATTISGGVDPPWLLYAPGFGSDQLEMLQESSLQYLLVDRRAYTPERAESLFTGTTLEEAIDKFDGRENASRIFDSGSIVIYDIGALGDVP